MKKKYALTNKFMVGFVGVITKARGYRFKIAETAQELQDAFDLRMKIYQLEVIRNAEPFPDEYDFHSVILMAYKGDTAIASMRMVLTEKRSMTTELYSPDLLEGFTLKQSVEIGGLVIDKAHRGGTKFVFLSLLHLALEWCDQNHRSFWIGISTQKKLELFKALNPNLIIKESVPESSLEMSKRLRRRENDRVQIKGKKPYPFVIDVSNVDYLGAVGFYLRKVLNRKPEKHRLSV